MRADFSPLLMLLVIFAGWVNRHQQRVIEYLVEENRVLKEQVMGRRLRLTDDQRRRLAAKRRRLGRRVLRQVPTIVTPDTILRVASLADRPEVDIRAEASRPFFTSEVWTPRGLITYYTPFVMDLRSRPVHVAGSTPAPDAGS